MAKERIKVIREEMLKVADNVAQEKSIDKDSVFEAMELALEKAARVKYGFERDIRVSINRDSGDIKLNSYQEVVEKLTEEEQAKQITLNEAKKIQPNIATGEFIIKELHTHYLKTLMICFLYKLFECLRKSPSVKILIFPFFSLQQTKPNFFLDISFIAVRIVLFAEINGISFPFAMISFTWIKDVAKVPDG